MSVDIAGQAAAAVPTPTEGGAALSPHIESPSPTPAGAGQAPPPAPSPSTSGGGAAEGGPSGAGATPASATPGLRELARQYGYDLSHAQDDHQALQQLILLARRAEDSQQLAQYGQLYVQHAGAFQQFLAQQQQAQAQRQAQEQQWFKAPEWNPEWRAQITKDPATGELKPAAGAPADVVQKYLAAVNHQASFLERFSFDPLGTIKPGVEQLARQVAQELVQQHLGGYQEQQFAQTFVGEHQDWLFQKDPQGQPVLGPGGQKQLSPWGNLFARYVQEATQLGIGTEKGRADYALRLVRGDYAAWTAQQQQAQLQGQAGKDALLAQGRAAPSPAAHRPNAAQTPQGAGTTRISLADRMRQGLAQAGISGEQITNTLLGRR